MSKHEVTITVNGQPNTREIDVRLLLVHFIREELNLTGTHIGCDTTSCGACTVLLDGRAVKSCTVFAMTANGRSVETIGAWPRTGRCIPCKKVSGKNTACNAATAPPA